MRVVCVTCLVVTLGKPFYAQVTKYLLPSCAALISIKWNPFQQLPHRRGMFTAAVKIHETETLTSYDRFSG